MGTKEYNLQVKSQGKVIYPIIISDSYGQLESMLINLNTDNKKICIVSDSNVSKLYTEKIVSQIQNHSKETYTFNFQAGEVQKNLDTAYSLYEQLILWKFDRKDILIALGGGVVGDLTGYVAATYLRGISFIQIPTSLLAMVDSSIGGKTGVDFKGYKNMIGAFHQPKAVYININVLKSLPREHFYNGMAEIIKHGLIMDLNYVEWLNNHEESIHSFDNSIIIDMIYQSCIIKKNVVENDPKEQGDRALLNFGHTVGHGIEKAMNFDLLHGQCVSIGMVAASYISMKRGYIEKEDLDGIINLLEDFKLPVKLKTRDNYMSQVILENISHDKKQESGKLKFILLKEIGKAFIQTNLSKEEILDGIEYILL